MDTPPDPVDYWLQKAGLDTSVASRMMEAIRALPGPCAETLMHLSPYVVLPRRDVRDPSRPFVVPAADQVLVSLEGPPIAPGLFPLRFRAVYPGKGLADLVAGYLGDLRDGAKTYRSRARRLRKPDRVAAAEATSAELMRTEAGLLALQDALLDGEF
jgi:hypothetical protein